MTAALLAHVTNVEAFRISPHDTNYFAMLFDPRVQGFSHICVVEIFSVGGKTPPNSHREAHEFFYVLHGQGIAHCQGKSIPITKGHALLLRPGTEHVVENTGSTKLYTLTVMMPDEHFADMIRGGEPVELDDEDRAVLAGAVAGGTEQ
jgi:mannose-6-phosphate isomerase-like protein (cupin superfamily)